jgi:thiamine pyrophosphokinase
VINSTQAGTTSVIVIGGGDRPSGAVLSGSMTAPAVVVAVDHGLDHALHLGVMPDVVIGDLDSASPASVEAARRGGAVIEQHPADKDESDLELALRWVEMNTAAPRRVRCVAMRGGRIDHELVNLAVIAGWAPRGDLVTIDDEAATITVVTPSVDGTTILAEVGAVVTLLAIGGAATGVTTTGLQWPLANATLTPDSSWGLSNVCTAPRPTITCATGRLVAIITPAD